MADRCLLYYITDRSQLYGNEDDRRRALLDKIAEAAQAGIDYIQLREKDLSSRELEGLALKAVAIIRGNSDSTRLLINSRTDIALATGADGVHLRADDIAIREVRRGLGAVTPAARTLTTNHFLIGASCHSAAEVLHLECEGADFAVFAPVFGKSGGNGMQAAGLDALREACRAKLPVLALGGVTIENGASCLDAGAAGIAGIRLFQENKIEKVVQALRAI